MNRAENVSEAGFIEMEAIRQEIGGAGIGFTGAHRTGKTTVASKIAEVNKLPFLASSASQIAAELGVDLSQPVPYPQRLSYQEAILDRFEAYYESMETAFVADRTPLDMAAYLLLDVPNNLADENALERTAEYVDKCFELTNKFFACVVMIQPGIPYVSAPGKPPANLAYQEAHNQAVRGLLFDERLWRDTYVVPRDFTEYERRMSFVTGSVTRSLGAFVDYIRNLPAC